VKKRALMIASALVLCVNVFFAIGQSSGTNIEVLVSGVPFIPGTITGTLQSHLVVRGTNLFWTESSETPLRKISLAGGDITSLARKMGVPENPVVHGQDIFWIDARSGFSPSWGSGGGCVGQGVIWILNKTSLDGTVTEALAWGDNCRWGTTDIVVHETDVYWVNSLVSPDTYTIEKVPISGGMSTTLVSTSTPITTMARDATHLYWQEEFFPDPGVIKKMPLGGGEITVVFASDFNPLVGGFVIHDTEIVFADRGFPESYRLLKVSISGGPVTVLTDLAKAPRKIIAYDTNVYWIDESTVNSIPVNGGDITTLASGLDSPVDLEFDTASLYWTESVCCAHGQKGSVKTVPITGGAVTVLVDGVDAPGALALDASNIYWTEGGPMGEIEGFGRIAKVPIGGGAVTTWAGGISSALPPIAVDETNVYIADNFTIKKVPIDGGTVEKLIIADNYVGDLTTDGINVYWIDDFFSVVYKIPVNGGTVVILGSGGFGPSGPIDVDDTHVYLMDHFDTIKKVPISGGSVVTIATDLPFLSDLAVDGTNVYFSEQDTGNIKKVSVNGGAITTLANGLRGSWNILALDQLNVYWIDQVKVGKVPKVGGTVTYIAVDLVSEATIPNAIAADEKSVYWTEVRGGTIKRTEATQPIPDIKANGSDGPVTITQLDNLSVTVALDPGIYSGVQADWWVLANAPFGWYYYDLSGWRLGISVTYQGSLFDLDFYEVLNTSGLPIGTYNFYFGVDGNVNGVIDDPLYYDTVEVNIMP
jgi:hypothetical protein